MEKKPLASLHKQQNTPPPLNAKFLKVRLSKMLARKTGNKCLSSRWLELKEVKLLLSAIICPSIAEIL